MKDRYNEILALRASHDAYRELLARVADLTRRHPRGLAIRPMFGQPRFRATYCSQCGAELGPGNAGVSRCSDHRAGAARGLRRVA